MPKPEKTPAPLPTFTIEKGVLIPARGVRGEQIFPLLDLEIGDSFVAPPDLAKKARSAAHGFAKREGVRLTCRVQPDGSVRIWRLKK